MIVKLQFESKNGKPIDRGELGDSIIRAVDRELKYATWEASDNGWIARK